MNVLRWIRRLLAVVALGAAVAIHQRIPWIPLWYPAALIALPIAAWRSARLPVSRRRWRWSLAAAVLLGFVALLPVPWMKARLTRPPGTAWPLDGQLVIEGDVIDPPGSWYWLTAGRPPVVAEVIRGWLDPGHQPVSMHDGRVAQRPALVEPTAAAVGLRRAGVAVGIGVTVEVSEPTLGELPGRALLSMVNGAPLTTRDSFEHALATLDDDGTHLNSITTAAGESYRFRGTTLPYARVDVIDTPVSGFEVAIGGRFARALPVQWYRNLSTGSSHGLMVALISYVHASGDDLAAGRSIAGTGGIRGDGTVRTIGDLWAKATAARDVGADVLLFPAAQAADLDGFDRRSMRLLPVTSLDDAIAGLSSPSAGTL
jgi:hypothetical protein